MLLVYQQFKNIAREFLYCHLLLRLYKGIIDLLIVCIGILKFEKQLNDIMQKLYL